MDQGKGGDGIRYHHQQQQTTTIHGEQDSLSGKIMLSAIVRLHIHRRARRRLARLASSNPSPPPPSAPCGLDPDLLRSLLVVLRVCFFFFFESAPLRANNPTLRLRLIAGIIYMQALKHTNSWGIYGTAEKNELCGEKIRLKADKEKLEQQLKAMDIPPAGYMPHLMVFHPAMFAPPGPTLANKVSASQAFPGVPMIMSTNVLGNRCSGS
ncbi:hypothetical protein J5N97_014290 [Dioscorea zingiberensis]|uniref:Uncharacterized protein n=1 Tax=Dioscorea zingiberensis TaxID=325984 RepID=A0A9D5CS68_9LILI|nr:hypothetical protein J5N97_014290 [Dioscorea zingiberensis]